MLFSSSHLYGRRGRRRWRGRRGWAMASARLRALPSDSWVHRQPTIGARMVVLKGSVNRHSQSRSQITRDAAAHTDVALEPRSLPPLPTRTAALRDALVGANQRNQPPTCGPCTQQARACHGEAGLGEGGASSRGTQEGSWRIVGAPKGTRRLVEALQPRHAPFRTRGTAHR